jgi:hypothetical protein
VKTAERDGGRDATLFIFMTSWWRTSTGEEILFADAILSMRYRLHQGLGHIPRETTRR